MLGCPLLQHDRNDVIQEKPNKHKILLPLQYVIAVPISLPLLATMLPIAPV